MRSKKEKIVEIEEVTAYLHSDENDPMKREKMNDLEEEKGNCFTIPVS